MNLIFSIMGLVGGLLCCVGDVLFDLKGEGNKKLETSKNIDSNWSKMSEWRFRLSIICAMFGVILVGFGFYAIADMIRENNLLLSNLILITGFIECIGGLFRKINPNKFQDLPGIIMPNLGLTMTGVIGIVAYLI